MGSCNDGGKSESLTVYQRNNYQPPAPAREPCRRCGLVRTSTVEDELLGVEQRPEDVLVSALFVRGVLGNLRKRRVTLFLGGLACEGPQEQLLDLLGVRSLVLGQRVGPSARPRQLVLNLVGVQQV